MRTDGVAPRRGVGGSTRSRIAWLLSSAAALQACLCSSLSTAGDVAGGRGLVMPAGVGASGSFAGAHARADRGHAQSCDTAEDSMDEDIKLHLGEMDDLVAQMSQFQVCHGARSPSAKLRKVCWPPHKLSHLVRTSRAPRTLTKDPCRKGQQFWPASWINVLQRTIASWRLLMQVSSSRSIAPASVHAARALPVREDSY